MFAAARRRPRTLHQQVGDERWFLWEWIEVWIPTSHAGAKSAQCRPTGRGEVCDLYDPE